MSGTENDDWASLGEAASRAPDARRERQYAPSIEYVAGEMAEVAISLTEIPADETEWRSEIRRVTGLDVPEHRKVELAQVRYWGAPEQPNIYCRFLITDRADAPGAIDAVQILKDLRDGATPARRKAVAGTGTFVISLNDWQTAKIDGGGTAGLALRLLSVLEQTEERIRELRKIGRQLPSLVIIGGGDMIEGCTIFENQAYQIDSDRRGQIRATVAMILAVIDRLAPLFKDVRILAVGGNHGENRINGKKTNNHDNDDCAVFEHAAAAASRDKRLKHVKFFIAQDEMAKSINVEGHILATTHGHVFGRGSGGAAVKAHRWFSGQAAGRFPAGDADLLVTHHYHHWQLQDWGACLWVQTPALDGGSPHFTDSTGMGSKPGVLTFVMTPTDRYTDAQVLEAKE